MKHYRKIVPALLTLFILLQTFATSDEIINIGELSREEPDKILPVDIISGDPKISVLAHNAFGLHGGYAIVSSKQSVFTFRFDRTETSSIQLTIESGHPKKTLYTETFSAKNSEKATFKAADRAVEKTLGIPGFFSSKLAFIGERQGAKEVYISDLLFQNVRQLTHDRADIASPAWSPDAKTLLFTSYYKSGFPDIFSIDLTSGQRQPFATYSGTNTGATFSPDGLSVAMILSSSGNPELYISDARGQNPRRITNTKDLEASPTWSPDSSRIILSSDPYGSPQLYKVTLTDGSLSRLPTNISRYCAEPAWNPINPNLIAFTAAVSGTFQIALYDMENQQARFLTSGNEDHIEAVWMNDGRHLVITERDGARLQLQVFDTLTGKKSNLHSKEFGNARMPAFVYANR